MLPMPQNVVQVVASRQTADGGSALRSRLSEFFKLSCSAVCHSLWWSESLPTSVGCRRSWSARMRLCWKLLAHRMLCPPKSTMQ